MIAQVTRFFFLVQATNYVLSHQEEDSAGEIETKLIKVSLACPQLFKGELITLSKKYHSNNVYFASHWIVVYLMGIVIRPLNNHAWTNRAKRNWG